MAALRRVHDPIDLDLRTPEAEADRSVWREFRQIKLPPVVDTGTAEQPRNCTRFVFPVWP